MMMAGVALGGAAAGIMWRLGRLTANRIERAQESRHERLFSLVYLAGLVWILLTVYLMAALMPTLARICSQMSS